MINWNRYLDSVCQEPAYTEWERRSTPLGVQGDIVGTQLDLMVQDLGDYQDAKEERNLPYPKELKKYNALEGLQEFATAHVVLCGTPGSGKTTALHKLFIEKAKQARKAKRAQIPVFVSLRRHKTSAIDLVRDCLQSHGAPVETAELESLLNDGLLFLLCDGIDELPTQEARADWESFRHKYHHTTTRMVFSNRGPGPRGHLDVRRRLEMMPLSPRQIESFAHAFIDDRKKADEMPAYLEGGKQDLAHTPLFLRMLCSIYVAEKTMPDGPGQLFRTFAKTYERGENTDVTVSLESWRWWPGLLAKLAYHMMESGEEPFYARYVLPRDEAETILGEYLKEQKEDRPYPKAAEFLDDLIGHHLLRDDTYGNIEFSHQLVQQYYAAEHLLTRLPGMSPKRFKCDVLNCLKWTEPVAMMMEFLNEEDQAFKYVRQALSVDPMLGARLAGCVKKEFQERTVRLVADMRGSSEFKTRLLRHTHSDAAILMLIDFLEHSDENMRIWAAEQLGVIGGNEAILPLVYALDDERPSVRSCAAKALGQIGGEQIIEHLIEALEDEEESVRSSAALALGETGSELVIPHLVKAQADEDPHVGREAVVALQKIRSPEAFDHVIRALENEDWLIRVGAVEALGNIGGHEAIQYLSQALGDQYSIVRENAVRALGNIGTIETAIPLVEALVGDESATVGFAAAYRLGRIGTNEAIGLLMWTRDTGFTLPWDLFFSAHEMPPARKALLELTRGGPRRNTTHYLDGLASVQESCGFYNLALLPVDRRFCFIHLSDLHFGGVENAGELYEGLLLELKKDLDLDGFEALVISGDVVNKCSKEGYAQAHTFLENILRQFNLLSGQVFVVPGDHDVSFDISESAYTPKRRKEAKGPIDERLHIDKGEYVEVKNEAGYRKRFDDFQTFRKEARLGDFPEQYAQQVTRHEYPHQKVLMVGLNSSWMLDHHYTRRSRLHPEALNEAIEIAADEKYDDWVKIAVWHHPVKPGDAVETESNRSFIKDDGFMERLATAGFSMILHGHAHEGKAWCFSVDTDTKKYELHVVGAGTQDADEDEVTPGSLWQYNIITVTDNNVKVECRKRVNPRGISRSDRTWLKNAPDKSTYEFEISGKSV